MRGILMIEPLYHQVIKGAKTQTRRSGGLDEVNVNPDNWEITGHTGDENQLEVVDFCDYMDTQRNIYLKPRYKIGEVLYLKEPIAKALHHRLTPNGYMYKYGVPHNYVANYFGKQIGFNDSVKWSNKLFMPASAARAFVRITGIRCERLMDISDQDCIAEGVNMPLMGGGTGLFQSPKRHKLAHTAKESFMDLYKFANKVKDVPNIWVFVYEFQYLPDYKI